MGASQRGSVRGVLERVVVAFAASAVLSAEEDRAVLVLGRTNPGAELHEVIVDIDHGAFDRPARAFLVATTIEGDPPTTVFVVSADVLPTQMLHGMLPTFCRGVPSAEERA